MILVRGMHVTVTAEHLWGEPTQALVFAVLDKPVMRDYTIGVIRENGLTGWVRPEECGPAAYNVADLLTRVRRAMMMLQDERVPEALHELTAAVHQADLG